MGNSCRYMAAPHHGSADQGGSGRGGKCLTNVRGAGLGVIQAAAQLFTRVHCICRSIFINVYESSQKRTHKDQSETWDPLQPPWSACDSETSFVETQPTANYAQGSARCTCSGSGAGAAGRIPTTLHRRVLFKQPMLEQHETSLSLSSCFERLSQAHVSFDPSNRRLRCRSLLWPHQERQAQPHDRPATPCGPHAAARRMRSALQPSGSDAELSALHACDARSCSLALAPPWSLHTDSLVL